ncbi:hypothetical protein GCM10010441_02880 [Kitasatospora paracochleata]
MQPAPYRVAHRTFGEHFTPPDTHAAITAALARHACHTIETLLDEPGT